MILSNPFKCLGIDVVSKIVKIYDYIDGSLKSPINILYLLKLYDLSGRSQNQKEQKKEFFSEQGVEKRVVI